MLPSVAVATSRGLPVAPRDERTVLDSYFSSLLVTQCRTAMHDRISALQQVMQIQAGSPFNTMSIVRLAIDVARVP